MTTFRIIIMMFLIGLMWADHMAGIKFNGLDFIVGCFVTGMVFWEILSTPASKEPIGLGKDNPFKDEPEEDMPQLTWRDIDKHAQVILSQLPSKLDLDAKIQIIEECRDQLNYQKEQSWLKDSL